MRTTPAHVEAREDLRLALREAIATRFRDGLPAGRPDGPFVRVEVPADGLEPLAWLEAQGPCSRGYWSDRDQEFELAGVGRADVLTGEETVDFERLMDQLHGNITSADGDIRYFGGARFMEGGAFDERWRYFRAYRFILPRFEVYKDRGRSVFACNARASEDRASLDREIAALSFGAARGETGLPRVRGRTDLPDRTAWTAGIDAVLEAFAAGDCEKVVLAREVHLECEASMDAAVLVRLLRERTRHRFHFCFQPSPDAAFVGGSPEHLYRRESGAIYSEAIAGTRPRGATSEEDERYHAELLESDKERREQGYVVDAVAACLDDLCQSFHGEHEPHVLSLGRTQHLVTRFEGALKAGIRDADILGRLHPTPAVGGYPTAGALRQIARWEPFDRGWFAGPVGWVSRNIAQFAVGIRSALVTGGDVRLFSGAGVVTGSTAEEEWAEVESKIRDFLDIFGVQ